MSYFKSIIVAGTAAASITGSSFADNEIWNKMQQNFNTVYAHLFSYSEWVGGDLRGTSVAIGNNFSATTEGTTFLASSQRQLADVGAKLHMDIGGVGGDVDLTAVGICNNLSLNHSQGGTATVNNDQRCQTLDPFAIATVNLEYAAGDVAIGATSIANNLSVTSQGAGVTVNNWVQANPAEVYARVDANIGNVGGNVALTAAAIGNNAVITHGF